MATFAMRFVTVRGGAVAIIAKVALTRRVRDEVRNSDCERFATSVLM